MKITIIGAGNMGGATAIGLAKGGLVSPEDITATAKHQSTLDKFSPYGIKTSLDNVEASKGADIVMLVVKPWFVEGVVNEIKDSLDYSKQIVICMAAGIPSSNLLSWLDKDGNVPSLLYVIPNTAIEILQSMSFVSPINATSEQTECIKKIFESAGSTLVVPEKNLSAGTALASCGIAFAMRYIRAAAEGGVELGFYPKDAVKVVCQTVMGAASLISEHGSHPEAEIDKVTTPGGITIKGLNAMEREGFTNAVIAGLKASK